MKIFIPDPGSVSEERKLVQVAMNEVVKFVQAMQIACSYPFDNVMLQLIHLFSSIGSMPTFLSIETLF